jgi:hypothetical protein
MCNQVSVWEWASESIAELVYNLWGMLESIGSLPAVLMKCGKFVVPFYSSQWWSSMWVQSEMSGVKILQRYLYRGAVKYCYTVASNTFPPQLNTIISFPHCSTFKPFIGKASMLPVFTSVDLVHLPSICEIQQLYEAVADLWCTVSLLGSAEVQSQQWEC